MPSLGADMDSGTLLEWRIKPGDEVHKGDVVAVVDTEKSAVDVECFTSGTVTELLVEPGKRVPVGTVLATLDEMAHPEPPPTPDLVHQPATPPVRRFADQRGVDVAAIAGTGPEGAVTHRDVEQAARNASPPAQAEPTGSPRARITPYARRLARERGVSLEQLAGASDDGVVRASDVPASAAAPTATDSTDRSAAMRAAIARSMARSKREIPHYYLATTIDLDRSARWLTQRNRELPMTSRIVMAALLLKATATALTSFPALNGTWADDQFTSSPSVHLGVAVSLRGGGLIAPALHDAQNLTVEELMAGLRDLVERVRRGSLRGSELSDPTVTVTNLGEQGVEVVHGVIHPPQVALIGFGRVVERPVAVDGLLGVRPTVSATLAADHRVSDGYSGARFLNRLSALLQEPEDL